MVKVLHVVDNLDRGAIEHWLTRMLAHAVRQGLAVDWTFYCVHPKDGELDEKIRSLGGRIVHSPAPLHDKIGFLMGLRVELRRGKYDVLHCHDDIMNGYYYVASFPNLVRHRVCHIHNADEVVPMRGSKLVKNALREILRTICLATSSRVVGISHHTLDTFLKGRARHGTRDVVHYYGVDPSPFLEAVERRSAFRSEIGLPPDAVILLFAGRIVEEKNPLFAVDVLSELAKLDKRAFGMFVGDGLLAPHVRRHAEELGISKRLIMLGWRHDVAAIMKNCDIFILPRPEAPKEGFGLAVVEAQLAGMKLLLSRGIADDPMLPRTVFSRVPLAAGAVGWAAIAHDLLQKPLQAVVEIRADFEASPMEMQYALKSLLSLYDGLC